jgi:hypothetical protein
MKSNRNRFRHSTVYKNSKGKIVKREDTMFGGTAYHLEDVNGNYVQEISVPFKVSDYL